MKGLREFVRIHLGCGDVESPIWFVGPEPAGGSSYSAVQARVNAFLNHGSSAITNLRSELIALNETKWFDSAKVPTQAYWRRIAHVQLAAFGAPDSSLTIEAFRHFQKNVLLGDSGGAPLLIETSALPSKNDHSWTYHEFDVDMPELASRKEYLKSILPQRLSSIASLINNHNPKIVLLCGSSYADRWSQLRPQIDKSVLVQEIPHPCAHGITHEQWTKIGRSLQQHL